VATEPADRIRVGAVNYLNTRPLIHQFGRFAPGAELVLDLPSRLADGLASGRFDIALIPIIELFQDAAYTIVSDACIACRGPVLSVKLFSRVPIERVRSLALDEGSRTSVALVRILLWERFALSPALETLPIGAALEDSKAEAVLLIGDRAIHSPARPFANVWDLGDEWRQWTGLPFVFAVWAARQGHNLCGVDTALAQCRDLGVRELATIARNEAPTLGLTQPECLAYLRDNLHFYLGPEEQEGMARFRSLAAALGLAPPDRRAAAAGPPSTVSGRAKPSREIGAELGLIDCPTPG
jgi:chorismate dehydratase